MKHFVWLAVLSSCMTANSTGIASSDITCDTSLTYANFGSAFVQSNCLSCHASKERPILSTQAQVAANANAILDVAVYTDDMPRDASLTNAERTMLGQWLMCGAP